MPNDDQPDPIEVWNPKTEEMQDLPAQKVERFQTRLASILGSTVSAAIDLADIAESTLYEAGGFTSFKDFVKRSSVPFGYKQARKYRDAGKSLIELYGGVEEAKVEVTSTLEGEESDDPEALPGEAGTPAEKLGIEKLYQVRDLPDKTLRRILEDGEVQLPDGRTVPVGDVLDRWKQSGERKLEQWIEKYEEERAERHRLEEKIKKERSEREADQATVEEADRRIERAEELEMRYGKAAETYGERERALQAAGTHVRELRRLIVPLGLGADVETGLCNQLQDVISEITAVLEDARQANASALQVAEDKDLLDAESMVAAAMDEVDGGEEEGGAARDDVEAGSGASAPGDAGDRAYPIEVTGGEAVIPDTGEVLDTGAGGVDIEASRALHHQGWRGQATTEGEVEFVNDDAGLTTRPQPDFEAAKEQAQTLQKKRADGTVPARFRLDDDQRTGDPE
jgi:hypothetical protein